VGLQVGRGLDDVGRADHPADPPAGHRVGLRDAVEDDRVVGELGAQRRDRAGLDAVVQQVLVDLVGHDPQAVLGGPGTDRTDLVGGVDGAGRVRRGDEQQDLGALGARRLELVDGDLVVLGLVGEHLDGDTAGELDALGVRRPVRRREEHLVARVEHRGERLVDRLLAAVGHQHVGRRDLPAGVALGLGHDGPLQLRQAAGRGVAVVLGVSRGLDRGVHDVARGREVRLARTEPDHRAALRLERLRLRIDLQGRRLGDGADPLGHTTVTRGGHGATLSAVRAPPATRFEP